MGSKPKDLKKQNVPAPNAYNSEKSEEYLEGGIKHSFGVKPEPINKFKVYLYLNLMISIKYNIT